MDPNNSPQPYIPSQNPTQDTGSLAYSAQTDPMQGQVNDPALGHPPLGVGGQAPSLDPSSGFPPYNPQAGSLPGQSIPMITDDLGSGLPSNSMITDDLGSGFSNNFGFAPPLPSGNTSLSSTPTDVMSANSDIDSAPVGAKQGLIEKLRNANNVLVTVNSNPSVDQLSAAIGLTVILNKLDKHATAVYSGQTPSAIEFLEPEKTIEKNTDSLRDFIIALDKAKADKLRYKVEDTFVKIFITPYHTSLGQADLEFSQGDFNVDVVVAIGVNKREELDQAITAHGRILHDAVTITVNNENPSDLGSINWFQADASSLSEMLVGLVEPLQGDKVLLDIQTATAFLTGVVAETERFSNEKTTPHTMNVAALLMKAGANQQLVSSKLNITPPAPTADDSGFDDQKMNQIAGDAIAPLPVVSKDGALAIEHKKEVPSPTALKTLQQLEDENRASSQSEGDGSDLAKIHIDDNGMLVAAKENLDSNNPFAQTQMPATGGMVMQPPSLGGDLSSAARGLGDTPDMAMSPAAPPIGPSLPGHNKTIQPLTDLEKQAGQGVINQPAPGFIDPASTFGSIVPSQDDARLAVASAANSVPSASLQPIAALNAQPIDLGPAPEAALQESAQEEDRDLTTDDIFPAQVFSPTTNPSPLPPVGSPVFAAVQQDPSLPPPVPPPMMPPSM